MLLDQNFDSAPHFGALEDPKMGKIAFFLSVAVEASNFQNVFIFAI